MIMIWIMGILAVIFAITVGIFNGSLLAHQYRTAKIFAVISAIVLILFVFVIFVTGPTL